MGPNHHRKSFPTKLVQAVTTPTPVKATDETIGFTVPRKARSASVKRSHESWSSVAGGGGETASRPLSPARPAASQATAVAPISPPSPNASVKKKLKHTTAAKQQQHHRPPKIVKAAASSLIQDDIEIEVAEVLYGLKTSSKQEAFIPKDSYETKSGVSSPSSAIIPASQSAAGSAAASQNTPSVTNSSTAAIAQKRKKPRPVKYEDENLSPAASSPFASPSGPTNIASKSEGEPATSAISSPKTEKAAAAPSAGENAGKSEADPVGAVSRVSEVAAAEVAEAKDKSVGAAISESSPRAMLDADRKDLSAAPKSLSAEPVVERVREEKFKIDLMAPPTKSSPERDSIADLMADKKPSLPDVEVPVKLESLKAEEKERVDDMRLEDRKAEAGEGNLEAQKLPSKLRTLDLQLDFDQKQEKDEESGKKQQPIFNHKPPLKAPKVEPSVLEKPAQSSSVTAISMAMDVWPGGLPPLGYMGQVPPIPVSGIVPLNVNNVPSAPIQPPYFLVGQSRPKRCATHFYIAQNIHYHEQLARMNPFWPAGPGSAPICGTNPYNLNVVPPSESAVFGNQLPGPLEGSSSTQDKASAASFPGQQPNEKSSSLGAMGGNLMDANQRMQQFVLQQGPQHGSANNMLGPAFIFPLNQQQAAAAAARSSSIKSGAAVNNGIPATNGPNLIPGTVTSSVSAAPPATMSFNFANVAPNEAQAQYLAILQNGGYPFPIPAHVGDPPSYRGSHPHPVPFFSGSFFSSQMLHPSQLQQQQSQTQPAPPVGHHMSTSSGSSSTQKRQQQQRAPGSGINAGQTSSNHFQPRPPMPTHQLRPFDSDAGVEESLSAADSRASHAQKNSPVVYNHNFAMPIPPHNFALLSPAAMAGHGDKSQQQQLPPNLKGEVELGPSQFAMSITSAGLDFSAMPTPNHPLFQSLPETARHQMAAAAAAAAQAAVAQHKKTSFPSMEESKATACDSSKQNTSVEDRKRASSTGLHSLPLSRPDANDPSVSGNSALEGSNPSLNLNQTNGNRNSRVSNGTSPTSTSSTVLTPVVGAPNFLQQQQPQIIQMQKQQQLQLQNQQQIQHQIVNRSKPTANSNSPAYQDRFTGGSKLPNPMSVFPPALMQTNSPSQSPQWKPSMARPSTPVPSSTASSAVKGLSQQPGTRAQQPAISASSHAQISFSVNPKSVQPSQQFRANSSPTSSVVGSPTTKNGGGVSANKPASVLGNGLASTSLPSQTPKNSSSTRKSSPGGSCRNTTSMPSNALMPATQSPTSKPLQQLQQQTQLFFSNPYLQNQSPQSMSNSPSGYYQRKPQEQQHNSPSSQQNSSIAASSSGMLSLSSLPLALPGGVTSDPAKAVAAVAAANNIKGLATSGIIQPGQFPAPSAGGPHSYLSIPYLHTLPAVPVKPTDQKPATGNDNLRTCWQPEKR